ncbi:MAG: hypothetical protein HQK89_13185, partial [Nitrospirae bacterium]|nr:hypothetical protein [Nitrospirota bacterium]
GAKGALLFYANGISGVKEINPIQLYKELQKTNCCDCGQRTYIMAFAAVVSKGDITLDGCRRLCRGQIKSPSKTVNKVDWRENMVLIQSVDLIQTWI